ncbi:UDP-glucuronosyltransferase 2C1-like [Lytechinus variegatus]|uniref:UDP-glucuronosyltransferase 2C1-like n=1 Tax=Lytechinus variegatus TaxID=7654 RepID=UPI001BB13A5E|nr:UDP-glucuronosyltransferase 2C1-like [Lytechinus variegatus]
MGSFRTILGVLLWFLQIAQGRGSNILIYTSYGAGSHFMCAAHIGNELKRRGHNVTVIISNAYENRSKEEQYKDLQFEIFKHSVPVEEVWRRHELITKGVFKGTWRQESWYRLTEAINEYIGDCEALFNDKELLQRLRQAQFDVALVDPYFPCTLLVAEYAAKRHVSIMATSWSHLARYNGNPANAAYMPEMSLGFTNQMTLIQRAINCIMVLINEWMKGMTDVFSAIQDANGICPGLRPRDLYQRSQLLLANVDFAFEFPVPVMPNLIPIGGISTRPAGNLTQDLEEFVQSSGDDGIIIFSLGTYVMRMEEEFVVKFANAFARLPQKVLWQFRGTAPPLVDKIPNIKTMEWLPQNDLLGHNKTRVLMYQGGNNGLYEALYHAVPVVVIPLFADQSDIAARVTTRGMGLSLDIVTITSEKIVDALNAVIHDKKYKETVTNLSAIFHDRPMTPLETAVHWIEHVLKHGGGYMRSPIHDLTWYQYYLLDVVAVFLLVFITSIVFVMYSCKLAFKGCKRMFIGSKAKTE